MKIKNVLLVISLLATSSAGMGIDTSRYEISGWGWLTFGKFEKSLSDEGESFKTDFKDRYTANVDAGLKASFHFGKYGKARLHMALTTAYPLPYSSWPNSEPLRRKFSPYLIDAAIEYNFKLGERQSLMTEFGYLPVKYNPQAMNLGEYLFRSGTYPALINSGFELADKEKLVGLHAAYKTGFFDKGWAKADLFFNVEMRDYPINDLSLSYILTASPFPFFELGAGLSHQHLIELDKRLTTPGSDTTFVNPGKPNWPNYYWRDSSIVKTASGDSVVYKYEPYTFRGTKAMVRLTLDIKSVLPFSCFGKEDLKIYGEAAVLGLKNYPGWYEKRLERTPAMFGFNFPTFKLLDVLAIEAQYYGNKYLNSYQNIYINRSPVPYTGNNQVTDGSSWKAKTDDDWRFSIYASKKIVNHIRISLQFATDNSLRTPYAFALTNGNYNEIMTRTRDWYWMSRFMYYF